MHEWRKRVKDVCYHSMALSAVPFMEETSQPLDGLAECLGEYHDLALLGVRAAEHKKIAARVSAAKRNVGKRCFEAAENIFHDSAKKFGKALDRAAGEAKVAEWFSGFASDGLFVAIELPRRFRTK